MIPRSLPLISICAAMLALAGCNAKAGDDARAGEGARRGDASARPTAVPPPAAPAKPSRIQSVHFHDPLRSIPSNDPVRVRGARNETAHFALQINDFPEVRATDSKKPLVLRLQPLKMGRSLIPATSFTAYQVLPMPVDTNQAAYVRHTGLPAASHMLPRALLPLPAGGGAIPLSAFRDPRDATNPSSHAGPDSPAPLMWVDVHIPPTIPPGEYTGVCELLDGAKVAAWITVSVTVHDFVMPDERHLHMVGLLDWDGLARLYPAQFETTNPALISRGDKRFAAAVKVLDDLVRLAQSHRMQVVVPRLQPSVKWPAGRPVQIDWTDYDALVTPWLKGDVFADLVPLAYWPLPVIDNLELHAASSRAEYWREAAAHFDQLDWLPRSSVAVEKRGGGVIRAADSLLLSELAAQVLDAHPRIRVSVPLTEEQVQLATPQSPKLIPPNALERLMYAAPALVAAPPIQRLPEGAGTRWLRTDLPGLIPYVGAGADEREARLWSWLAFFRRAQLIQWPSVLPTHNNPRTPVMPDQLAWFYPGEWFGIDRPLPTIQLKWMRRAQQDYEYLWLARQRGQFGRALLLARLMTRPVEIQPTQEPDALYALMSGTSDPRAWTEALELVTRTILVSQPGQSIDPLEERQLIYRITAWSRTQERPMLIARANQWSPRPGGVPGSRWVDLDLSIDIYNASEQHAGRSALKWQSTPADSWAVMPDPIAVPQLGAYSVNRYNMHAQVNLERVSIASRQPVTVNFTEGYSGRSFPLQLMLPLAVCERRQGVTPTINGSLEDWYAEDAVHEGRLVRMMNRPAVQRQELALSNHNSAVYSTWSPFALYLAFRVEGADAPVTNAGTNLVDYQLGRAWGEDLCEVLVQPVYEDNSEGPLLYVALKPRGQMDIRRRSDPRLAADPWRALVSADVGYGYNLKDDVWRGELSIPWEALNDNDHRGHRPVMLRFNFSQHRGRTGESASWAGPIDFGRDEHFTGLLDIRAPERPAAFTGGGN